MQLVIDIKNDSISDKIIQLLNIFKNDGVEIRHTDLNKPITENQQSTTTLSDDYIEKNWRKLIITKYSDSDYYKSEQYKIDRAIDWEERGKI